MAAVQLVYAACPSRLAGLRADIMGFVGARGHACLHPFNAFPYEYFEGGMVGRDKTMEWCCRLVDACDELWCFGVSEGTCMEVDHLLRTKGADALRSHVDRFDPEWRQHAGDLADRYPRAIAALS